MPIVSKDVIRPIIIGNNTILPYRECERDIAIIVNEQMKGSKNLHKMKCITENERNISLRPMLLQKHKQMKIEPVGICSSSD